MEYAKETSQALTFRMRGQNGASNTFILSLSDEKVLKIIAVQKNKEVVLSISDVNVGNQIAIEEDLDILKEWGENRILFKILKL